MDAADVAASEGDSAAPDTAEGADGGSEGDEPQDDEESERPAEVVAALAKRAEILDPITTSLARRLKRALQDDQNRLLDRLRKGTGEWHDDLLVDEESRPRALPQGGGHHLQPCGGGGDQLRPFDPVGPGARTGSGAGHGRRPERRSGGQRRDAATAPAGGWRRPYAAERVGAAYREWRGERIERLAEDRALEAFGAGVLRGSPRGATLVWVTGEGGPGCADCDDNALGGEVAAGEEFPTGHRHPPAHPGCRWVAWSCRRRPDPANP